MDGEDAVYTNDGGRGVVTTSDADEPPVGFNPLPPSNIPLILYTSGTPNVISWCWYDWP